MSKLLTDTNHTSNLNIERKTFNDIYCAFYTLTFLCNMYIAYRSFFVNFRYRSLSFIAFYYI